MVQERHGTRRSLTFSTTTTNKSLSTTTNKVVTKLDKTILKASPPKEISLHKAKHDLLLLLHKRVLRQCWNRSWSLKLEVRSTLDMSWRTFTPKLMEATMISTTSSYNSPLTSRLWRISLPLCLQPPSAQWDLYQGNQSRIPKSIAMLSSLLLLLRLSCVIMRKRWIRLKASRIAHNLFPKLQHKLWKRLNTRLWRRLRHKLNWRLQQRFWREMGTRLRNKLKERLCRS